MSIDTKDGACGCCEGREPSTPTDLSDTRPGLAHLPWRVGTHGRFKASMLLHAGREPRLARLTARTDDDPAIALMDAWAMVLDVLTFYQERLANEHYLSVATERRSILELARAIGYELRPGVAATTALAFAVEDAPGAPRRAEIEPGTRVQSVPGRNELPQTFETGDALEARAEWNVLRPIRTKAQLLEASTTSIYLEGTDTRLRPGDLLLIVGPQRRADAAATDWRVRTVTAVDPEPSANRTRVSWRAVLASFSPLPLDYEVHAFRQHASMFGHNAPDWRTLLPEVRAGFLDGQPDPGQWPDIALETDAVYLDALYDRVLDDSWLWLRDADHGRLMRVTSRGQAARTDFTLTAKVSRLEVDQAGELASLDRRGTRAFIESERLTVAEAPRTDAVTGTSVELEQPVLGLEPGRHLLLVEPAEVEGGSVKAELARLDRVEAGGQTLVLERELGQSFDRARVKIHANVVLATHGETRVEPIGSGDAGQAFTAAALRGKPLTHVPSDDPSGASSTLAVRASGVAWHEAPSLFGLGPRDRSYTTRRADDGTTRVLFGDGRSGARPPSGRENLVATYRVGSGLVGEVAAGQLSLLPIRPHGVRSVTNPLPAAGAADPERREDAQRNAPLTVTTLDRIVSLQDYEDFARAFAGIGKAQATALWEGARHVVHLTIGDVKGAAVPPSDPLYGRLAAALDRFRDPLQALRLDPLVERTFALTARVVTHPDHEVEVTVAAARGALAARFAAQARDLAQSVAPAEVLTVLQGVPGIVAAALDLLERDDGATTASGVVPAWRARRTGPGQFEGAELLTVDDQAIDLIPVVELTS